MAKTKKKKAKNAGFDPLHIKGAFEDLRPQFMDNLHAAGHGLSDVLAAISPSNYVPVKGWSGHPEVGTGGNAAGANPSTQFDPASALSIYDLSSVQGGPQAIISYLQQTDPASLKDPTALHKAAQALGLTPAFMAQPKTNLPDPLTMAMVYQSTIQPFMNNILTDSRQQTQHYQDTMNQKLGSMNLAPNVKSFFEGAVPAQVARMNTGNDALAASMAAQPGFDSFLQGLQGIQKEQNKLAAGQQQASLGSIASLFGSKP